MTGVTRRVHARPSARGEQKKGKAFRKAGVLWFLTFSHGIFRA